MDEELSWKDHIDQIATKILQMTGIMAKARHYLCVQTYCCIKLTSTYPTRLTLIFTIQEKISKNNDLCKTSR